MKDIKPTLNKSHLLPLEIENVSRNHIVEL